MRLEKNKIWYSPLKRKKVEEKKKKMSLRVALLLIFLCVSSSLPLCAIALTTRVDAGTSFCFNQRVPHEAPYTFQFEVVAGGKRDISATVTDTTGNTQLLKDWRDSTQGQFTTAGTHPDGSMEVRVCLDNSVARFTPKWVSFTSHVGPHPNALKKAEIDPIEKNIAQLQTQLDFLSVAQQRLTVSEREHRNTLEDANERILLWTIFEALALFAMGIFQIFFLKKFLEVRARV